LHRASRRQRTSGIGGKINTEAGYVLAGLFFSAFAAVPLGMPIGIMLATSGFSFREAFNDSSLRGGALVQTVVALWSYIELYRALRTYSPAQLKLRQRFALVFMSWVVVIMVAYFILDILPPSELALLILVVAYIAGSVVAEIAPDRFLLAMPGDVETLSRTRPRRIAPRAPEMGRAGVKGLVCRIYNREGRQFFNASTLCTLCDPPRKFSAAKSSRSQYAHPKCIHSASRPVYTRSDADRARKGRSISPLCSRLARLLT
jgi:hypothetical protein